MHDIIPIEESIVGNKILVAQGPDDFDFEEIEDGEGNLKLYRHA